jgi:hypothetical protein
MQQYVSPLLWWFDVLDFVCEILFDCGELNSSQTFLYCVLTNYLK